MPSDAVLFVCCLLLLLLSLLLLLLLLLMMGPRVGMFDDVEKEAEPGDRRPGYEARTERNVARPRGDVGLYLRPRSRP